MEHNPVGWFEIYVQDLEKATRFYETVFQTTLSKLDGGDAQMRAFDGAPGAAGAPGTLVKKSGVPSGGSGTLVYFECGDCAVEEARVSTAGGQVHRPKMAIGPYGFISLVVDTEGNMIGLHSMK